MACTNTSNIHNEVKLCTTRDRYPVYTTRQDAGGQVQHTNTKKQTRMGRMETGQRGRQGKVQASRRSRQIECAAKAVNFSTTTARRQNAEKKIPEEVTIRERAAMRGREKKSSQKTSKASTSQTCCKMQFDAGKRMSKSKPLKELCVSTASSHKTEPCGKKNCKDTVKKCTKK